MASGDPQVDAEPAGAGRADEGEHRQGPWPSARRAAAAGASPRHRPARRGGGKTAHRGARTVEGRRRPHGGALVLTRPRPFLPGRCACHAMFCPVYTLPHVDVAGRSRSSPGIGRRVGPACNAADFSLLLRRAVARRGRRTRGRGTPRRCSTCRFASAWLPSTLLPSCLPRLRLLHRSA